jgi:DNA replication protein DnaC
MSHHQQPQTIKSLAQNSQQQQSSAKPLFKDFREPKLYDFGKEENLVKLKKHFATMIESEFYEYGRKLEINEEMRKNLNFCMKWVIGIGIDVKENKGLQFIGPIGLGKSAILKAVFKLAKELYSPVAYYFTANKIAHVYRTMSTDEQSRIDCNRILTCKLLFIDDIGTEDIKVFDSYPIQEVIRDRYDKRRVTSFTTNIVSPGEMVGRYTESIEDKMNHGTYRIEFHGQTKRPV